MFRLDPVLHPKITDVQVTSLGARGCAAVLFKLDLAFVVLLKETFLEWETLCREEVLNPDCVRKIIACANPFDLGRARGDNLLFSRLGGETTSTEGDDATSVVFNVWVHCKSSIDPRAHASQSVGAYGVFEVHGALDILKDPS